MENRKYIWVPRGVWVGLIALVAIVVTAVSGFGASGGAGNRYARAQETNRQLVPLQTGGGKDALLFDNGDLLLGQFMALNEADVQWHREDVDQLMQFQKGSIEEIHLHQSGTRQSKTSSGNPICNIRLTNGDEFEAAVIGESEDGVRFSTWYAGDLVVPPERVQWIIPVPPAESVVFDGLEGIDGWTLGDVDPIVNNAGQWRYEEGAFYATKAASIARDVGIPEVARVEFDLAWQGMISIALALYTDYMQPIKLAQKEDEPEFGDFYSLQLNSYIANLLPVRQNQPLKFLGQATIPSLTQKNHAAVEVYVDSSKRAITLVVDGKLVKQWVDPETFSAEGSGIRIVHQGRGSVRISNLKISHWDGQFGERPMRRSGADRDIVKLKNGDSLRGEVQGIAADSLQVKLAEQLKNVPWEQIKHVAFAWEAPEESWGTVRAYFADAPGHWTFELERWGEAEGLISNPALGEVKVDTAAFERLQFGQDNR